MKSWREVPKGSLGGKKGLGDCGCGAVGGFGAVGACGVAGWLGCKMDVTVDCEEGVSVMVVRAMCRVTEAEESAWIREGRRMLARIEERMIGGCLK